MAIDLRAISSAEKSVSMQRARGGERIVAARADAHDMVLGLQDVAGAGQAPGWLVLSATIIIASRRRK